jgi:glycerol kinase
MEADAGLRLAQLRTDGGMVANELLMQFQADILDRTVIRPAMRETTALGAAYAAALACGYYSGIEDLMENWEIDRTWQPRMEESERSRLYGQWKKAVTRSFDWIE